MLKRNNSMYTKCYLLLRGLIAVLAAKNALLSSHISERTETCQILFPLTKSSCTVFYSNIFRYNYVYNNIYIPSPNPPMFVWKIRWKQMHLIRFFFKLMFYRKQSPAFTRLSPIRSENNNQGKGNRDSRWQSKNCKNWGTGQQNFKDLRRFSFYPNQNHTFSAAKLPTVTEAMHRAQELFYAVFLNTSNSQKYHRLNWLFYKAASTTFIPKHASNTTRWQTDRHLLSHSRYTQMTGWESKHTSTGALKSTHCDQKVRAQQAHKKLFLKDWCASSKSDILVLDVTYWSCIKPDFQTILFALDLFYKTHPCVL